jgi:hypothetical protein
MGYAACCTVQHPWHTTHRRCCCCRCLGQPCALPSLSPTIHSPCIRLAICKGGEEQQRGPLAWLHRQGAQGVKHGAAAGGDIIQVHQQRGVALEAVVGGNGRGECVLQRTGGGEREGRVWCVVGV